MAVQYERYENDIEAAGDLSSDSDDPDNHNGSAETSGGQLQTSPRHLAMQNRWPNRIGISQSMLGFIILILGVVQVIILPLAYSTSSGSDALQVVRIYNGNFYGIALWAGIALILTGTLGVRASWYKDIFSLYVYFSFVLLDMLAFTSISIMLIVGFSSGWAAKSEIAAHAELYLCITIALLLAAGYILVVLSFIQYYEEVFCGELQLCRRFIHCCLPCCCPRVVQQEELMAENPPRLPSLPM